MCATSYTRAQPCGKNICCWENEHSCERSKFPSTLPFYPISCHARWQTQNNENFETTRGLRPMHLRPSIRLRSRNNHPLCRERIICCFRAVFLLQKQSNSRRFKLRCSVNCCEQSGFWDDTIRTKTRFEHERFNKTRISPFLVIEIFSTITVLLYIYVLWHVQRTWRNISYFCYRTKVLRILTRNNSRILCFAIIMFCAVRVIIKE